MTRSARIAALMAAVALPTTALAEDTWTGFSIGVHAGYAGTDAGVTGDDQICYVETDGSGSAACDDGFAEAGTDDDIGGSSATAEVDGGEWSATSSADATIPDGDDANDEAEQQAGAAGASSAMDGAASAGTAPGAAIPGFDEAGEGGVFVVEDAFGSGDPDEDGYAATAEAAASADEDSVSAAAASATDLDDNADFRDAFANATAEITFDPDSATRTVDAEADNDTELDLGAVSSSTADGVTELVEAADALGGVNNAEARAAATTTENAPDFAAEADADTVQASIDDGPVSANTNALAETDGESFEASGLATASGPNGLFAGNEGAASSDSDEYIVSNASLVEVTDYQAFASSSALAAADGSSYGARARAGSDGGEAYALSALQDFGFVDSLDSGSVVIGVGGGYDYQFENSNLVIGLHGDVTFVPNADETSATSTLVGYGFEESDVASVDRSVGVETDMLGSARIRLGYALDEDLVEAGLIAEGAGLLPYVTGGVGFAHYDVSVSSAVQDDGDFPGIEASSSNSFDETAIGGVVGGGLAYRTPNGFVLSLEGLYYMFDETHDIGDSTVYDGSNETVEFGDAYEIRLKFGIFLN